MNVNGREDKGEDGVGNEKRKNEGAARREKEAMKPWWRHCRWQRVVWTSMFSTYLGPALYGMLAPTRRILTIQH